jgi:hypothetical protein
MQIGSLEFQHGTIAAPGETVAATVHFLANPDLTKKIHVGTEWRIQEGMRLVAIAKIDELMGEK